MNLVVNVLLVELEINVFLKFEKITEGKGTEEDLDNLKELAEYN